MNNSNNYISIKDEPKIVEETVFGLPPLTIGGGNERIIDLPSGSVTDSGLTLISDTSGNLSQIDFKQIKDYIGATGGTTNTGSLLLTSSFQTYTASILTQLLNVFASESNYVQTSSFNTFSSSYHTDSASFNTRIIAVTGSGTNTSFALSEVLGITSTGDQTATINAAFANSNYSGLILDLVGGGSISISGSVNAQGKYLMINPNTSLTTTSGSTINNVILDLTVKQSAFNVSISFTNTSTVDGNWSAYWYGYVIGNNDVTYSLQKSIDTVVANSTTVRTLKFIEGTHWIIQPLVIYNWNGSSYSQVSIKLSGLSPMWAQSGHGTVIRSSGLTQTFLLGIQLGKGCEVEGIEFQGEFTPPAMTTAQFYTSSFLNYTDGVCADNVNQAHVGIAIDPFANSNVTSSLQGFFPNINSYYGTSTCFYRGPGGQGGSTACTFNNIFITNVVLGVVTAINGQTQNAELMSFDNLQLANLKAGIVGCEDQEKCNIVGTTKWACWGSCHTLIYFPPQGYGEATDGNWIFKNFNGAGQIQQLIHRAGTSFPVWLENFYVESLGTIGSWSGTTGDTFTNATIDFVDLGTFPHYPNTPHITTLGVTYRNINIRYYGSFLPVILNGGLWENCTFEVPPYAYNGATLLNCGCGYSPINSQNDSATNRGSMSSVLLGNSSVTDSIQFNQGKRITWKNRQAAPNNYYGFLSLDGTNQLTSSMTITGTSASITPPTNADLNRVILNRLAINAITGQILGITNSSGSTTYQLSYVPTNVTSSADGNCVISLVCPTTYFSFLGNTIGGDPTITGVVQDAGTFSDFLSHTGGFIMLPDFWGFRSYAGGTARILTFSTGSYIMDRPAFRSSSGSVYFSNGRAKKEIDIFSFNDNSFFSGAGLTTTEIFPKGSYYNYNTGDQNEESVNMITKTGYYASASLQATWYDITIAPSGSGGAASGSFLLYK